MYIITNIHTFAAFVIVAISSVLRKFVSEPVYVLYLSTKFHLYGASSLLIIVIEPNTKYKCIAAAILLFYIQKQLPEQRLVIFKLF